MGNELCSDCPPFGYPTDNTRCDKCPLRAIEASSRLFVGLVIQLGARLVRVCGSSDGMIYRGSRNRIAVRNFTTNRLSYIPEWRLIKAVQSCDGQYYRPLKEESIHG